MSPVTVSVMGYYGYYGKRTIWSLRIFFIKGPLTSLRDFNLKLNALHRTTYKNASLVTFEANLNTCTYQH